MITHCHTCKFSYDDAECTTICPHGRFLSPETQEQKDAGLALLGKTVTFNHMNGVGGWKVTSVGWTGMVTLAGMPGEFAPHIFQVKM